MATSRIPAAIDGLLALCNAAAVVDGALEDVAVYDGPPIQDPSAEQQLYIGHDEVRSDSSDVYAAEGTQVFQTMGGARQETFAILCAAVSRTGDTDMKSQRDRAYSIVGAVENLIRLNEPGSDITLGGAVLMSNISGDMKLQQIQTTTGAYVKVSFHVQCLVRM